MSLHGTHLKRRKWLVAAAVAAFVAMGTAAAFAATSSKSAAGAEPILLGNISSVNNTIFSPADIVTGTQAWVNYINTKLHGINGRPIKLITCDDQANPAIAIQCTNNLLQQGVVGFLGNCSLVFGSNALPTAEQAGTALLGGFPILPAEFTSTYEFPTVAGSAGSYPAGAVFSMAHGIRKLTGIWTQSASAVANAAIVGQLWNQLGGTSYQAVYFDSSLPDLTATAAAAKAQSPGGIQVGAAANAMLRMLQALHNAGWTGFTLLNATGFPPDVAKQAGSLANGMYVPLPSSAQSPQVNAADGKLYRTVMTAAHVPLDGLSATAASGAQYAYDVLKSIKGPITRATLLAAARSHTKWPGFLSHSMSPQFAPPQYPSVRNPYIVILRWKDNKFQAVGFPKGRYASYTSVEKGITYVSGFPR